MVPVQDLVDTRACLWIRWIPGVLYDARLIMVATQIATIPWHITMSPGAVEWRPNTEKWDGAKTANDC